MQRSAKRQAQLDDTGWLELEGEDENTSKEAGFQSSNVFFCPEKSSSPLVSHKPLKELWDYWWNLTVFFFAEYSASRLRHGLN